jgi:hypothetical protein
MRGTRSGNRAHMTPEHQRARCALYLNRFWKRYEAPGADQLALLREAAAPGWAPIDENDRLALRVQYAVDYEAFLAGSGKRCQLCQRADWDVRHHVVPLLYGGINADLNLIALCDPWSFGDTYVAEGETKWSYVTYYEYF